MSRQPTSVSRLLAWLTVIVFLGAGATVQLTQVGSDTAHRGDQGCTIARATVSSVALVATDTVNNQRAPVPLECRKSDPTFEPATPFRLVAAQHDVLARFQARRHAVSGKSATLVGVVEFRI